MPKNVSILVYAGNYDMLDGPLTHEPWMRTLKSLASDNGAFWNQARKIFYIYDDASQ
jgi:hypothetical protein